jgi:antitoxin PrlF
MPEVMHKTALTRKSQITLPRKIREILKVGPGDQVSFQIDGSEVKVVAVPSLLENNFGKVKPKIKPEDFKEQRKDFEKGVAEDVLKEQ